MKTVKPYTCPGECRGHFQQLLEKVIPSGCVCVCVCGRGEGMIRMSASMPNVFVT